MTDPSRFWLKAMPIKEWINLIQSKTMDCFKQCNQCDIAWSEQMTTHMNMMIDEKATASPCGIIERFLCDKCAEKLKAEKE